MQLLGTMAVVNLLHPFWVSLAMLVPASPVAAEVMSLFLATFGFVVIIGIDRAQARLPRNEPRVVVAYRSVVPLGRSDPGPSERLA